MRPVRELELRRLFRPARDLSHTFTLVVLISWSWIVALPLLVSLLLDRELRGAPLLGILLWFGLIRLGRWLSPAGRAEGLMRRGHYHEALVLIERALAVQGAGTWMGTRRLGWLNRRTMALTALGQGDVVLAALEALAISADPETLGNCALALLRLNRYDEASAATRLTLALTRERSVLGNTVLASINLARGKPAEAEALARSSVQDTRALLPMARQEHYALCLGALCRATQALVHQPLPPQQGKKPWPTQEMVQQYLQELRETTRKHATLRAVGLAEEAEALSWSEETRGEALPRLLEAMNLWAEYVLWLISQPDTFTKLRGDERFAPLAEQAEARLTRLRAIAPSPEVVAAALGAAEKSTQPRPKEQASSLALITQVITLGSTFILLLLWTWRFFIAGSP
jgi:hypothetical protein